MRLFRSQEVERPIDRDPVKPGAQVRAQLESSQTFVGAKEGLLDDLFGVLPVAGHAVGHAKDAARVALHQQAECVPIAGQHLRHHGCIGYFHSVRLDRVWRPRLGSEKESLPLKSGPFSEILKRSEGSISTTM